MRSHSAFHGNCLETGSPPATPDAGMISSAPSFQPRAPGYSLNPSGLTPPDTVPIHPGHAPPDTASIRPGLTPPDTTSIHPGLTPGSQPSKLRKGGACPISFQNPRHPMQKCHEKPCLLYPPASQPQRTLSQHPFSMPLSQHPLPQHPFSMPPPHAFVSAPSVSMTGTRNQESGTTGQRLRSVFLAFPSVSISPKALGKAMESMM